MISCGWCGASTLDADWCSVCMHSWPRQPWEQRGQKVPTVAAIGGRPVLDEREIRRRYAEAKATGAVTVEELAERLDRSPRTVREWRSRFGLR